MAQEDLLKALERDVIKETEKTIAEAKRRADRIIDDARKGAQRLKEDLLKRCLEEIESKRNISIKRARIKARARVLAVKYEIMEAVFHETVESFKRMPVERYSGVFLRLYREAKEEWYSTGMDKRAVVVVNPDDTGLIDDRDVDIRPDTSVSLGVIFTSEDGRIRLINTIPSRLERIKPHLVSMLDEVLWGKGSLKSLKKVITGMET